MAAGWLGLGSVFTVAWTVASVPLVIFFVLVGIELVYYLAPGGDQDWQWLTPGAVLALGLFVVVSFGLRLTSPPSATTTSPTGRSEASSC